MIILELDRWEDYEGKTLDIKVTITNEYGDEEYSTIEISKTDIEWLLSKDKKDEY